MSGTVKNSTMIRCSCGNVELECIGAPITSVVCYCDDCQEGSRQIEALPNARPALDPDCGTAYVVYRRDRLRRSKGASLLKGYKIRERSATNRVVATCCNSAMFLNFDDGKHWVDAYRSRFYGDLPPLEMRICTRFKPGNHSIPSDVPSYPGYPFKFIVKLLGARVAMLLHR
jgi:hypothetical protein